MLPEGSFNLIPIARRHAVLPNVSTHTSYGGVHHTININGARDFDSFHRSRNQIEAAGAQVASAAAGRNS